MDYNYFTDTVNPPFQLYNFASETAPLSQTASNEATTQFPAMHMDTLAASSIIPPAFDYKFDSPMIHEQSLLPRSQASPTDQFHGLAGTSLDSGIGLELDQEMQFDRRASSEEKEILTPAQSRRKAQNRAAQRAFRERKERHVRDLEAKLNLLTTTTSSLQSDNERLKALLQKTQSENQLLRATAASSPASQLQSVTTDRRRAVTRTSTDDSTSSIEDKRRTKSRSGMLSAQGSFTSESSAASLTHMLSASATWDLLQNHPRYTSGCVDITKVCERLKGLAQCQNSGPVFDETEVRKIIDEVGGNGADELI